MADERKSVEHVALAALFIAFLKVSLCSFGGGLVWARHIAVEQRRWINEAEFADILSLCQFMPGPNVVGIAVCVGAKLRGLIGAIAAVSRLRIDTLDGRFLAWRALPPNTLILLSFRTFLAGFPLWRPGCSSQRGLEC